MTGYPRNFVVPTHINSMSRWAGAYGLGMLTVGLTPGSVAWGAANTALFVPLYLPWPYNARRMFFVNGASAGGNTDVGIYSVSGAKLWSSGSTVESGSSAQQYVTVSPDMQLRSGVPYFLAYAHDATTANQAYAVAATANNGRPAGLYQQAVFPLPASATFAAYAAVGVPLFGITNTDSGF